MTSVPTYRSRRPWGPDVTNTPKFQNRIESERVHHTEIFRMFHRAFLPASVIRSRLGVTWETIFLAIGVDNYDGYKRAMSARNMRRRRETGWGAIRLQVLERDARSCVVTGEQQYLDVHHINGDREDNRLSNLVSLARRVHRVIESPVPLSWWAYKPEEANDRLGFYQAFAAVLLERGFGTPGPKPDARGNLWFRYEGAADMATMAKWKDVVRTFVADRGPNQ